MLIALLFEVLARIICSLLEYDGDSEVNGEGQDCWADVLAGGDAAPVLQAPEHDLVAAATSVAALFVSNEFEPRFPAWDT